MTHNQYPHIESTPGFCGGRPRVTGSRLTVADIVILHLQIGYSVDEIAGKFDLPLAAVYSALAYYHDHRREIDESLAADQAHVDEFRRTQSSPLLQKLSAAGRG
jgi:uncharacterized protein (DUF433 family)